MKITNVIKLTIILLFFSFATQAQDKINDADDDTRIETELTADDDQIRFRVGGTYAFKMKNRTLEILNSGNSVFIGKDAGLNDDLSDNSNVFVGTEAGLFTTDGQYNVALGFRSLRTNTLGRNNMALGRNSMYNNVDGGFNVAIGAQSLLEQTTGSDNVGIGNGAGLKNQGGSQNVFIGTKAGRGGDLHDKSGSVHIGFEAGSQEEGSNTLYIDNSNTNDPLIYGDFATDQVGIGTSTVGTGYTLSVGGKILSEEVRVLLAANWPDYVFLPNYELRSLEELSSYIKENGHLPNIPSAAEVEEDGILLGDMQKNLLEKIEELTLYTIDSDQQIKTLQKENEILREQNEAILKRLEKLENK